MLTLNEFCVAYEGFENLDPSSLSQRDAEFAWHFCRPYVCVIHEPTGRGYYLDRNYGLVVEIEKIPRPGWAPMPMLNRCVKHETEPAHRASSFTTPEWAEALPTTEFTTYWLY